MYKVNVKQGHIVNMIYIFVENKCHFIQAGENECPFIHAIVVIPTLLCIADCMLNFRLYSNWHHKCKRIWIKQNGQIICKWRLIRSNKLFLGWPLLDPLFPSIWKVRKTRSLLGYPFIKCSSIAVKYKTSIYLGSICGHWAVIKRAFDQHIYAWLGLKVYKKCLIFCMTMNAFILLGDTIWLVRIPWASIWLPYDCSS